MQIKILLRDSYKKDNFSSAIPKMVLSLKWNEKYSLQTKYPGNWKNIPLLTKMFTQGQIKNARIRHPQISKFNRLQTLSKHTFKLRNHEDNIILFLNRPSLLSLTQSFSFVLFNTTKIAYNFFRVRLLLDALASIKKLKA